ncbi:MAG: hypothetical protein KDK90_28440 [Leptospiraceae bacterium]|nr:hypothetical protein [Leptospiraceae bacterium]
MDLLDKENIEENVKAIKNISNIIQDKIKIGNPLVVIPGRGIHPLFKLSVDYKMYETGVYKESENIREPFSLHIPYTSGGDNSKAIRFFYTNVLDAYLGKNTKVIYLQWFRYLHEILGFPLPSDISLKEPKGLIFIDTVKKGKAIFEILESFDSIGIKNYHLILLFDNNGQDIVNEYNKIYTYANNADFIQIPKVITEDQSVAITGTFSIVISNTCLTEYVKQNFNEFNDEDEIGNGILLEYNNSNFDATSGSASTFSILLKDAIDMIEKGDIEFYEKLKYYIDRLRKSIDNQSYTDQVFITKIHETIKNKHGEKNIKDIKSTQSHIYKVEFEEEYLKKLILSFKSKRHSYSNS